MCGIFGAAAFTKEGKKEIDGRLPTLLETSSYRGRDGTGYHAWEWGYVGSSRAQPMPEADEVSIPAKRDNLTMVFNGTISNDKELMEEYDLGTEDVDTMTVLNLWLQQGYKSCENLVGGYAFGVYDNDGDVLTIAKNFKTLWYVKTDDYFVFASEKDFLIKKGMESSFELEYPRMFPRNTAMNILSDGEYSTDSLTRKFWAHTPELDEEKAVIVTSGGIDSVTAGYIAQRIHKKDIVLLNFDYGQRAAKPEWKAVQWCASDLGVESVCVDLTRLGEWGSSPLTDRNIELPLGMQSVESTLCWTPGRNMLMVAYGAAYAEAIGAKWLYYGNNMEEEATGYSDNDLEFVNVFNDLLEYGTLKGVQIKRALGRIMKPEILHIGNYLKVPYDKTWSCDEGFEKPCGICGCCTTRQYAFKRAGLEDKQEYLEMVRDVYPWKDAKEYDVEKLRGLV